jgi:predicted ATPase
MSLCVRELWAERYRSLRALRMPVERLSVFAGENGAGKTNLYRVLQLLQAAAAGRLAAELAGEGGMESASWAGERRKNEPARIKLGVGLSAGAISGPPDFRYEVEIGFPVREISAAFELEPQVKEERLTHHRGPRSTVLLERRGPHATVRTEDGDRVDVGDDLMASETALGGIADPSRFPDLGMIRQAMADWRFYHDLRTDPASPLRHASLAITSPTLASDGSNLAAVFATLAHIREDTVDLDRAITVAFPGARLDIPTPGRTATFGMIYPEYPHRVFAPHELSDGTLRFLGLGGGRFGDPAPALVFL